MKSNAGHTCHLRSQRQYGRTETTAKDDVAIWFSSKEDVSIDIFLSICKSISIYIYVCVCVYVGGWVGVFVCVYVYVYIYG